MNKYSITMIIWKIKYRINDIIWRFECAIGKYLPIDFNGMFLNCDDCKYHKSIINHKITICKYKKHRNKLLGGRMILLGEYIGFCDINKKEH